MWPQNPLKQHMPLFWLQKWIQLGHVNQVDNFWLSCQEFMSFNMAAPYKILEICWITATSPKLQPESHLDQHDWALSISGFKKVVPAILRGFCGHMTSWWKLSILGVVYIQTIATFQKSAFPSWLQMGTQNTFMQNMRLIFVRNTMTACSFS